MTTHCKSCGAPVDLHAEKCAYCDSPYPLDTRQTQTTERFTIELDPGQLAGAVENAVQMGVLTPNEVRKRLGLEVIT